MCRNKTTVSGLALHLGIPDLGDEVKCVRSKNNFLNCSASDSAVTQERQHHNIFDDSVDLRETTEAHLACTCTAQCV